MRVWGGIINKHAVLIGQGHPQHTLVHTIWSWWFAYRFDRKRPTTKTPQANGQALRLCWRWTSYGEFCIPAKNNGKQTQPQSGQQAVKKKHTGSKHQGKWRVQPIATEWETSATGWQGWGIFATNSKNPQVWTVHTERPIACTGWSFQLVESQFTTVYNREVYIAGSHYLCSTACTTAFMTSIITCIPLPLPSSPAWSCTRFCKQA